MAKRRVLILDTSVLCCWLRVPGKEETGPVDDRWDHARIDALLQKERELNSTFVLPVATLIETGNHIAQAASLRFERAQDLARCLQEAAQARSPWAAFTDQSQLWATENLRTLADKWPALASQRISIGDATIKDRGRVLRQGWVFRGNIDSRCRIEGLSAGSGASAAKKTAMSATLKKCQMLFGK